MNKSQKAKRIFTRIISKICQIQIIESGNYDPNVFFPLTFSKSAKPYYLTIQEITFVECIMVSEGTKFKSSKYAPWWPNISAQEIQAYLPKFKKDCEM